MTIQVVCLTFTGSYEELHNSLWLECICVSQDPTCSTPPHPAGCPQQSKAFHSGAIHQSFLST